MDRYCNGVRVTALGLDNVVFLEWSITGTARGCIAGKKRNEMCEWSVCFE